MSGVEIGLHLRIRKADTSYEGGSGRGCRKRDHAGVYPALTIEPAWHLPFVRPPYELVDARDAAAVGGALELGPPLDQGGVVDRYGARARTQQSDEN
jgi:hypothetical protein